VGAPSCLHHSLKVPAHPRYFISPAQLSVFRIINITTIMPYFEQNPLIFFRVQDDGSQTHYYKHSGILSRNQSHASFDPRVPETLESIQDHLDWASREPSAYISVYSDKTTAFVEARRRLANGHKDVVIVEIDTREGHEMVQYRNVRRMAHRYGIWVPEKAWNNSKYEWLFLHRVPDSMIVRYRTASNKDDVGFPANCGQGSALFISSAKPVPRYLDHCRRIHGVQAMSNIISVRIRLCSMAKIASHGRDDSIYNTKICVGLLAWCVGYLEGVACFG
jgi:hypothetical protein